MKFLLPLLAVSILCLRSSLATEVDITKLDTFSAYRFHDADPVVFKSGLRLTCRCGDQVNGITIGNPPETRYTTYVWVYRW